MASVVAWRQVSPGLWETCCGRGRVQRLRGVWRMYLWLGHGFEPVASPSGRHLFSFDDYDARQRVVEMIHAAEQAQQEVMA